MYKDFFGYAKEPDKTETKYIVESIRDEKIWNKFVRTEDLDLYEKRAYDNIADALTFYLTWFVSDDCYDIKMWQQIIIDGEVILEEFIEPKRSVINNMRSQIDNDMKKRLHNIEKENAELKNTNNVMSKFIKALGSQFEEMFKDFCRREK